MLPIQIPDDLDAVLDRAWKATEPVPGYLKESEARLLGIMAACTPASGVIVEIGSFQGKSTVMLGTVAAHYGLGPVIAIDPHNLNNLELQSLRADDASSTFQDFQRNIESAGVAAQVEVHRAFAHDVSIGWNRPIRLLWIDGDHSYNGAKGDFDDFMPHLAPLGVVAMHDTLHPFAGPIRVFTEDVLGSSRFGAAGFVGSMGWAQYRPEAGSRFDRQRARLARIAAPLIPHSRDDGNVHGLAKLQFKLARARVPRRALAPREWASVLEG